MADKMTNVKALSYVLDTFGEELPADVKAKIEAIKAQQVKKNSGTSKADAERNEASIAKGREILAEMDPNEQYRVSTMCADFACLADHKVWTTSRVTSILTKLKEENLVNRFVLKGISYYSLADGYEAE